MVQVSTISVLQLPTAEQWFVAASIMFPIYGGPTDSKIGECDPLAFASNGFVRANSLLTHGMSVENRFSEARCAKSLPVAMSTYKEGLPSHYLEDFHNAKVDKSEKLLMHEKLVKRLHMTISAILFAAVTSHERLLSAGPWAFQRQVCRDVGQRLQRLLARREADVRRVEPDWPPLLQPEARGPRPGAAA